MISAPDTTDIADLEEMSQTAAASLLAYPTMRHWRVHHRKKCYHKMKYQ
jgi:hypothetical protein